MVDKSLWDTDGLQRTVCSILLKDISVPLSAQYNVETQEILRKGVFNIKINIICGVGERLGGCSCIRVWRVRKTARSIKVFQDFCP